MSSGTGGTIAGVGQYLKENSSSSSSGDDKKTANIILVDPPGSSLYNKIKYGVAYTVQQSERSMKKHRYDTLAEGIGLDRITANFALGCGNDDDDDDTEETTTTTTRVIDDAIQVSDQEAVNMAHLLLKHEGLFVGSSSAMNVVGAVKWANECEVVKGGGGDEKEDIVVVTVICDGGYRHLTRFWNREFVEGWGLTWPCDDAEEEEEDGHDVK
eukprot:15340202-Ditylum_brightwellii.AAC.1